jgi:toxin-antitoxin system PIN domain toxin
MFLPDTNVWLALTLSGHIFHSAANRWFNAQAKTASVLWCRSTQQSFLRLLTTTAMMHPYGLAPFTNAQAWSLLESLLADKRIAWIPEPPGLDARWKALAARSTPSPKLWMDAYLAAFAILGKHQLVTTDRAFTQFPALNALVLH